MKRCALVATLLLVPTTLSAQVTSRQSLEPALGFETPGYAVWNGGPADTRAQDTTVVRSGSASGRLRRDAESPGGFSTFALSIPLEFSGQTLELVGWLRMEDVTEFAGLWLREDGGGVAALQFDNMQDRALRGTRDWAEYRITLPIDPGATSVVFGALVSGQGTLWVDDLSMRVDGVPVWDAPDRRYDMDTEFDEGSGIQAPEFTDDQVEKLSLLGRVWGFAKYHHPRVTDIELDERSLNWDYELFRVLPDVLEAPDVAALGPVLAAWLRGFGEIPPCNPCAELVGDLHFPPDIAWIGDSALLGPELSSVLVEIHERRPIENAQRYVAQVAGVQNPDMRREASYPEQPYPDAGRRLVAVYRLWNVIEYWFPYRDVIGEDWDGVLTAFIPRVMGAADQADYRLQLMQMIARINDTHANLWTSLDLRPPVGTSMLPVVVRFVEGGVVVTGYSHDVLGPESGLAVGDVIESIGGRSIDALVEDWRPFYAASNEPTRLRDVARTLTRGDPGPVAVTGRGADGPFEIAPERIPSPELDASAGITHDRPGEEFQRLTDDVAYLKMSAVVQDAAAVYVRAAEGAEVLVIDSRNYPGAFLPFALGGHLLSEPTPFVTFTRGDLANPGAFHWSPGPLIEPLEPSFEGRVVVLVDEVTQSSAEYHAMAFRAAGALVVGSTTAGADGNVSPIPLPGGIQTMISGIGVFYPDRTPTQRVGIVPDLEVLPTIEGIRAGRDEVLEAGVSYALGREWRVPAP